MRMQAVGLAQIGLNLKFLIPWLALSQLQGAKGTLYFGLLNFKQLIKTLHSTSPAAGSD